MKKFFLVVILAFALCVTSCGIKTTESLTICTEPEYTPIINTLISCYNKVYPEVEFKILTLPSEAEEREATMIYITLDVEDAFDVELPPEAESAETVKDLLKIIRSVM